MEVVDNCQEKKFCAPRSTNQKTCPPSVKCTRRYVQPPRVKPFKPHTSYCPPKNPVDSKTTYCTSYLQDKAQPRPQPILPCNNINLPDAKFADDTTTHLSYKPVEGIFKQKPILPRQRICPQRGPMENVTTIRKDFSPKQASRTEKIIPCGHIRTSTGLFETKTTTLMSYVNPGPVEPVMNFRPNLQYCKPKERTAQETTQKLSYLPYEVGKKEDFPWGKKGCYKPPDISMAGETTYKKSYYENKATREKPIIPKEVGVFPCADKEIHVKTVYKESFLPCRTDPVIPIVPSGNICLANDKMSGDTTNKLSFQQVKGEKRKPILPRSRICGTTGSMPSVTTTRMSYPPKIGKRQKMTIPCGHIRTAKQPFEGKTTTKLSYVTPGHVQQFPNFRPALTYCKPEEKIEGKTVNKLSYQQWEIGPKESMPWAEKPRYCRPNEKMASDTIHHRSFPPPGYFIEECEPTKPEEKECKCGDSTMNNE